MKEDAGRIGGAISKMTLNPPNELVGRISFVLKMAERRKVIKEEVVFSLASFLSLVVFIGAIRSVTQSLYTSGASQIFSLLFSDFQSMISNWRYFTLSLAESLPAMSLALALASAAALLVFISLSARNFKNISRINGLNIKHA
ncbi:MAG: hypothetical protein ABSE68_03385 [Minisyncoccia bacterium]